MRVTYLIQLLIAMWGLPQVGLAEEVCSTSSSPDPKFSHELISSKTDSALLSNEARVQREYDGSWTTPASSDPLTLWQDNDFLNQRYDKQRHLYGWDQPDMAGDKALEERVIGVSPEIKRDRVIDLPSGKLDTFEIGNAEAPKMGVVFIHGAGGDKTLGANDWSFGGNFNRLQNIVIQSGGVYYSPSMSGENDAEKVADLIKQIKSIDPNTPVIMVCASAGGGICTEMQETDRYTQLLAGVAHVGSASIPRNIVGTPSFSRRVPLVISHGGYDTAMSWREAVVAYNDIKKADPTYPAQFHLVHGGIHGTPIRMIDWHHSLNYLLKSNCENQYVKQPKEKAPSKGSRGSRRTS